jgi:hypothetical protein
MKKTLEVLKPSGSFDLNRRTAEKGQPPQTLPVPHEEDGMLFNENPPPPSAGLDANVDIFFLTCPLPHLGQTTSLILLMLTNSSKARPHLLHANS